MRLILAGSALAAMLVAAGAALAAPRDHANFSRVSASAGTEVEITIGPSFSVDVSGRHADRIVTRVSGDQLIVEPQRGISWRGRREALVRVTMPRLAGVDASSGAQVRANGVNGGPIALDASSGANINIAGACASFRADVSSGANLRAADLRCESGDIDISSGGNAHVFASGALNVDASSGGSVVLHGGGALGNVQRSSGGSVRQAN